MINFKVLTLKPEKYLKSIIIITILEVNQKIRSELFYKTTTVLDSASNNILKL